MAAHSSTTCPTTRQLQQWLQSIQRGEDSFPTVSPGDDGIAEHLEHCGTCRSSVDRLSDALGPSRGPGSLADPAVELADDEAVELDELKTRLLPLTPRETGGSDPEETNNGAGDSDTVCLPCGTRLGQYEIEELIGSGGTSSVYVAWDLELQRTVALKVVAEHRLGERELSRWKHEAIALAAVEHPHVTRILGPALDLGNGYSALPLEYVQDGSLADLIKSRAPLPWDRVARIVVQAARGLSAIHQCGLVHRDIKPANVLLSGETAKIADLGLARPLESAHGLTRTGDFLGTPSYMSPEQCRGDTATTASDIYGLGATLYEALTGEPPFRGTPAAVLRSIPEGLKTRPRQLDPRIPADLETICLVAMAPAARDRYATAAEMAHDLECAVRHEPIRARRPGTLGTLLRWCGRHRWIAGLLALLLVSLTVGLVATTWQWRRAERHRRAADELYRESQLRRQESERQRNQLADKQRQLRDTVDVFTARLLSDPGFRDGISPPVRDEIWRTLISSYRQFLREEPRDVLRNVAAIAQLVDLAELGFELHMTLRGTEAAELAHATLQPLLREQSPNVPDLELRKLAATAASLLAEGLAAQGDRDAARAVIWVARTHADAWLAESPESFEGQRRSQRIQYQAATLSETDGGEPDKVLAAMRRLVDRWPDHVEPKLDLARAIRTFSGSRPANTAIRMRREAAGLFAAALEQQRRAGEDVTPLEREIGVNYAILGKLLAETAQLENARVEFSRALAQQRDLLAYQPNHHQWRNDALETLVLMAETYRDDPAACREWYGKAVAEVEALVQMAPRDYHTRRRAVEIWLEVEQLEKRLQHQAAAHASLENALVHGRIYLELTSGYASHVAWLVPLMRRHAEAAAAGGDTETAQRWTEEANRWQPQDPA